MYLRVFGKTTVYTKTKIYKEFCGICVISDASPQVMSLETVRQLGVSVRIQHKGSIMLPLWTKTDLYILNNITIHVCLTFGWVLCNTGKLASRDTASQLWSDKQGYRKQKNYVWLCALCNISESIDLRTTGERVHAVWLMLTKFSTIKTNNKKNQQSFTY